MSLKNRFPAWHVIVGYFVMTVGAVPPLLWVANYVDLIRPEEKPGFGLELFVSAGMLGIGWMTATEKGTEVWNAVRGRLPTFGSVPGGPDE